MQVKCNAGSIKTNQKGEYGQVEACYIPKGIANIFSVNEIEKLHRINYDSIYGYYVVHKDKVLYIFTRTSKAFPISI